jgi:pimeloyl-ACP methyl ester carboxylesterase
MSRYDEQAELVSRREYLNYLEFMKQLMFLLFLCTGAFAQSKNIPYGNNPTAGHYYDVRGIKLYVETYGKGRPLLLTHGNGGDISAFSKNIPYFEKTNRVIAVDSRAHGKSLDTGDSLSFEMMADDFAALLDQMQIDSADVIGWSDGGINAIVLAMRHPEKVRRLVSTGANLWPDSTALDPDGWVNDQQYYLKNKDRVWSTPEEKAKWKFFYLDWKEPNIPLSALQAIKAPSLIISGDRDVINLEHTVKIFQNIPAAYLWVIPHSGHSTLIEHADEFNRKVAEFLK